MSLSVSGPERGPGATELRARDESCSSWMRSSQHCTAGTASWCVGLCPVTSTDGAARIRQVLRLASRA